MEDIPGFSDPNASVDINSGESGDVKKKGSKKTGGFQSLGLSLNLLKGISKRGYKIPTPIQRKAIPLVLEGRDVVAMARTGSGKTACFLIPLFERLKMRIAKTGSRALILSPTRELALQTLKFFRELGKFCDLKAALILGGDSMDDQFSTIHGNPDVIVATPGRFLHVCVEMDLKLNSIEYIVFDEADRLFEMGFGEQLTEIVHRLPDSRQTVLFSATLPKILVEFAKAGLSDPVLIRLDVESKLPDTLQLWFLTVRPEERLASLLVLLKCHIDTKQQTIVFAATKHHVEYIHMVLDKLGITNTYIYSNLDPSARKIHAAKFSQGKVHVLIVTDVAARGIDIPQLDNVINYNFPAKSKLFLHRVGRCARAGRSGTAYSLVAPDEYAHLVDLHLFLGRPLSLALPDMKQNSTSGRDVPTTGRFPQNLVEEQYASLLVLHENNTDILSIRKVTENAYMQYMRSRPSASSDSNRRIKEMPFSSCAIHSIFGNVTEGDQKAQVDREHFIDQMKEYRPPGTVFEICGKTKSQDYTVMKVKRAYHKNIISAHHQKIEKHKMDILSIEDKAENYEKLEESNKYDIDGTFQKVILPKKRKLEDIFKKKEYKKMKLAKDDNYIPYAPADKHTEDGLVVNAFNREANKAQFDIIGDSEETMRKTKQTLKWDRKKKKMVTFNPNSKVGKIKTESGAWIPATYKGNRYTQWKEKTKATENESDDNEEMPAQPANVRIPHTHWARHNEKVKLKSRTSELKTNDQILKARAVEAKKNWRQNHKKNKKGGNKKSKKGGGKR